MMNDQMRIVEMLSNAGYKVDCNGDTLFVILEDGMRVVATHWTESEAYAFCNPRDLTLNG